jgi:hypothetical protein
LIIQIKVQGSGFKGSGSKGSGFRIIQRADPNLLGAKVFFKCAHFGFVSCELVSKDISFSLYL